MIPLTTNVRLKQGLPPAVTSIILITFYMVMGAQYPGIDVILVPWGVLLYVVKRKYKDSLAVKRTIKTLIALTVVWVITLIVLLAIDLKYSYLVPNFQGAAPYFFHVSFKTNAPDVGDLVLSIFGHASFSHWFGNMLFLWVFGSILEDRIGWKKFMALFLLCGIFGQLLYWFFYVSYHFLGGDPHTHANLIGASGAVFGIMGICMSRFYNAKIRFIGVPFLFAWTPFALSVPLWMFCAYRLIMETIAFSLFQANDHTAHLAHLGGFAAGWVAGRWLKFDKENMDETLLAGAENLLTEGSFRMAESEYRSLLKRLPEEAEAHLGLAESLFGQTMKGVKTDPAKKEEALQHYQWVLNYYIREHKTQEAVGLYKRLLGHYSAVELGERFRSLIGDYAKQAGGIVVHGKEDFAEHQQILLTDFNSFEGVGNYFKAHVVLVEILEKYEIQELEPSFLSRAGEVCLRVKDIALGEKIFETVAKRGDLRQTVRALDILARYWLRTPKQPALSFLYKDSSARFHNLYLFPEWVELGEKLKG